ncbi:hypothetical protein D3C84_441570 [compost metagenome]
MVAMGWKWRAQSRKMPRKPNRGESVSSMQGRLSPCCRAHWARLTRPWRQPASPAAWMRISSGVMDSR